jgi:hypothetical protein
MAVFLLKRVFSLRFDLHKTYLIYFASVVRCCLCC